MRDAPVFTADRAHRRIQQADIRILDSAARTRDNANSANSSHCDPLHNGVFPCANAQAVSRSIARSRALIPAFSSVGGSPQSFRHDHSTTDAPAANHDAADRHPVILSPVGPASRHAGTPGGRSFDPHCEKRFARDPARTFVLEPSACQDCTYTFRDRTRLTRPSRCPRCRSEAITSPRYGIREESGS